MKINTVFIPTEKDFAPRDKRLITALIQKHARRAAVALKFHPKTFTFTVYSWQREGANGFTQAREWVRVGINAKKLALLRQRKKLVDRLIYLVYHEVHHAARGYAGYLPKGQYHVLINSVVSEGLADVFGGEQHPAHASDVRKYTMRTIRKWLPRLRKVKRQKELYDFSWLYGGNGKPKLLGYKLGHYIVTCAKKRNPRLTAAKLVRADAKKVIKLSGLRI